MGIGEALSIGSALAWAGGVVIYTRLGRTLPPLHLNLFKNLLVFAMLVPTVLLVEGARWPAIGAGAIALALASGAIGIALADTLYFRALNTLGAGHMGVIGNLYSPLVIVLSFAFLGERLDALQIVGFVLVMSGVGLVSRHDAGRPLDRAALRRGVLLGAAAIALMAVAIVMIKRTLEQQPLLWVVAIRLGGAILGMLVTFALGRRALVPSGVKLTHGEVWLLLAAAFLGQYLSMILWLGGYKFTDASIASILNESASVFIVLLAWLFLREPLDRRRIAGVGCTLAGLACMLLS